MDTINGKNLEASEKGLIQLLNAINSSAANRGTSAQFYNNRHEALLGNTQVGKVIELDDEDATDNEIDNQFVALKKLVDDTLATTLAFKLAAVQRRIVELEAQVAAEAILNKNKKVLNKKTLKRLNKEMA